MIRIAILGSRGIPASYGGFESFTEQLARDLDKDEFVVYVATEKKLKTVSYTQHGVTRVFFPVSERIRILSEVIYDAVSLLWSCTGPIDVVLLLGYAASPFCIFPKLSGKAVIIHPDGLEWKRRKFNRMIRFLLRLNEWIAMKLADFVIADSKKLQRFYLDKYGRESVFIPYSAEVITKAEVSSEFPKDTYYLVVARLEPENNIDDIICGYILSESKKNLVIVGPLNDNDYVRHVRDMSTDIKTIIFLGGIYNKERLRSLRLNCFAYLHGSEVGGTSPSLLEALGCGNLVIAKDVPYHREVLESNEYYFNDASSLASCIKNLELVDESTRMKMHECARQIISDRYNSRMVTDLCQFLFHKSYELRH